MFDEHRERLIRRRSKYWNASGSGKYKVYQTPCLCSCHMCSCVKDNSPNRYKFSDVRKLDKAKEDLDEIIRS